MTTATPLIALVGNPNAGKSALFNALTGARQKTGNYAGVTVERHAGRITLPDGRPVALLDLPGTYSLEPASPDEQVTHDVVFGTQAGERRPDALIVVIDAANLEIHLRFVLEIMALGLPVVVALNMIDMAARDGLEIDPARLSTALGVPVIPTVAVRRRGIDALKTALLAIPDRSVLAVEPDFGARTRQAQAIAATVITKDSRTPTAGRSLDRIALHPVFGPILLAVLLFTIFQAVFAWATPFADAIDSGFVALQGVVTEAMPESLLRSLITDGVIAGIGAVVVFLPQIVILFSFILILEQTGYMARAAMLMDRLMARVGLSGRAFIPLLSSFACAVPGIMATRTIEDPKDRLTTIMIAPLMTCSARLPVYAVIIAAFIPDRSLAPGIGLQGVVMFALYVAGVVGALIAAFLLRRTLVKGRSMGFIMELPRYQWPHPRDLLFGLWQKAWAFLKRAGTIIAVTTIILWALLSFPRVDPASGLSQIDHSIAGRIANGIAPVVAPIGFNRDIALALIPAMSAREMAVAALATTYAIDDEDETHRDAVLADRLAAKWSLPTALAFLAWFVFAPQCISTIAVVRRETNGWKWTGFMLFYLFALAYLAAGLTFWLATAFGL